MTEPTKIIHFPATHDGKTSSPVDSADMNNDMDEVVGKKQRNPTAQNVKLFCDDQDTVHLRPNTVYVLVGKPEGVASVLGPYLQNWGARTFVFLTNERNTSTDGRTVLDQLRHTGANVEVYTNCLSNISRLSSVLSLWNRDQWRIGGIIYDRTMDKDIELDDLCTHVMEMKALHEVTAHMPLDFFVTFSGVQRSADVDVLATHRAEHNLPFVATSIDCYCDQEAGLESHRSMGHCPYLDEESMVSLIKNCIHYPNRTTETCHVSIPGKDSMLSSGESTSGFSSASETNAGSDTSNLTIPTPAPCHDPNNHDLAEAEEMKNNTDNLPGEISGAATFADATDALSAAMVSKMARLLGTDEDEVDIDQPLGALGVDSFIAAEFCNWLKTEAKSNVDIFELLGARSLGIFADEATRRSTLLSSRVQEEVNSAR
ncbi:hypothetical protein EYZ11_007156 [Aspergillus tanneri]|nr:hypothetical protein EYZ11_007156 [Aspergillus tanneri]